MEPRSVKDAIYKKMGKTKYMSSHKKVMKKMEKEMMK